MSAAGERNRRRTGPRARTINTNRLSKEQRRFDRMRATEQGWRRLRDELGSQPCRHTLREHGWCPHVGCRYHLYLDVNPATGSIKLNFPDLEVWEMEETCALDVADRGGVTLRGVGAIMNLTRERIRQVELKALDSISGSGYRGSLRECYGADGERTLRHGGSA